MDKILRGLLMDVPNVLGDTRPVERVYGDGTIECPWCFYPITGEACANPWCVANPLMPADAARRLLAEAAAQKAEKERRERDAAAALRHLEENRQAAAAWRQAQIEKAKEGGYCLECLFQSNGRVKFIKHRKPRH